MHPDISEPKDWADVLFLKREHCCSNFTEKKKKKLGKKYESIDDIGF